MGVRSTLPTAVPRSGTKGGHGEEATVEEEACALSARPSSHSLSLYQGWERYTLFHIIMLYFIYIWLTKFPTISDLIGWILH